MSYSSNNTHTLTCHSYCVGESVIDDRTQEEKEDIIAESKIIVEEGWNPTHVMIDKSSAEKHAIEEGMYNQIHARAF